MGMRFRKSVKLAPGVRMNLSKSGFSWTLGPRGASVGVGRHGVYGNVGIPGTGISARNRLDGASTGQSQFGGTVEVSASVGIRDDGTVYFIDKHGNPQSDRLIRLAKRQHRSSIRGLIDQKCDEINEQIEALGELHMFTPPPSFRPRYEERRFEEEAPKAPVLRTIGI